MAGVAIVVFLSVGIGKLFGLPPAGAVALGFFGLPALIFVLGALFAGIDALVTPIRIRRCLARIDRLDETEALDGDFDEAFESLDSLAPGVAPRRTLGRARAILLTTDRKSRRWFLKFLGDRMHLPGACAIVREISRDWTDPLNPRARKITREWRRARRPVPA